MAELFRLPVVNGRVLIPARMKSRLGIKEGDELRVLINDNNSVSVNVARDVVVDRRSENDEKQLAERRANLVPKGKFVDFLRSIGSKKFEGSESSKKASSAHG